MYCIQNELFKDSVIVERKEILEFHIQGKSKLLRTQKGPIRKNYRSLLKLIIKIIFHPTILYL